MIEDNYFMVEPTVPIRGAKVWHGRYSKISVANALGILRDSAEAIERYVGIFYGDRHLKSVKLDTENPSYFFLIRRYADRLRAELISTVSSGLETTLFCEVDLSAYEPQATDEHTESRVE